MVTMVIENERSGCICKTTWQRGRAEYVCLRTFALIVSAHPYCARNSGSVVMPRLAWSASAVEEMQRYTAQVGILISIKGLNGFKCSVTQIVFWESTFFIDCLGFMKTWRKSVLWKFLIFLQLFCPCIIEFRYHFNCTVLANAHLKGWV